MTHFAPYSSSAHSAACDAFADDHIGDRWDNLPDDRIGPPSRRSPRKLATSAALATVMLATAGWVYLDHEGMLALWPGWLQRIVAIESTALETRAIGSREPKPAVLPEPKPDVTADVEPAPAPTLDREHPGAAEPVKITEPPVQPQTRALAPASPSQAATAPPPAALDESQVQKSVPAVLAPYQKRAAAVGLHTELSRLLLESLTDADYRNAALAIRKALAEKEDAAVVLWPRKSAAEQAQFQVHFVAGAPQGCRRYVVTVAKQGWLTTALPVEKCVIARAVHRG